MSPASMVVLAGCIFVIIVGSGTLAGFLLHRRREKRNLERDLHHSAIWMNDYSSHGARGLAYWYAENFQDHPDFGLNASFQGDSFPIGRLSEDFGMVSARRCRHHSHGSCVDTCSETTPVYPTFAAAAQSNLPSTPSPMVGLTTSAQTCCYPTFPCHARHSACRRLPRYDFNSIPDLDADSTDDDGLQNVRCAYP